jgi:hypothetical protein
MLFPPGHRSYGRVLSRESSRDTGGFPDWPLGLSPDPHQFLFLPMALFLGSFTSIRQTIMTKFGHLELFLSGFASI